MIELAKWDSENFGIKVGNVIPTESISEVWLDGIMSDARRDGYNMLYLKGITLPEKMLSDNIVLADEKVIYAQITKNSCSYDEHVISILNKELSDELLALAYESGKYSRYNLDGKFQKHVFPTLYKQWMGRSLSGEIATEVLGYVDSGRCCGMLTYKVEDNNVDIGLVAVSPEMAGKGIGSKLMHSFLSHLNLGTRVEVATQKRNTVACHYYEKNGFVVDSITNVYHIWL